SLREVLRLLLAVVPGLARLRPPVQRSAAAQEPDEAVRRPFRAGVLGGTAPRDAGGAHRSPQPTLARARWIAVVRHRRAARLLRRRQPIRPRARLAAALRPPTGRTTGGGAAWLPVRRDVLLLPGWLRSRVRQAERRARHDGARDQERDRGGRRGVRPAPRRRTVQIPVGRQDA